jgi:hypothetical protein
LAKINQILTLSGIRTQQDKAERPLKTSPELMLEKTTFTDCSGRTFSNISAFEYALWALDTRYMVDMMLNCLPQDKTWIEIAAKLLDQYNHFDAHGVTYTMKDPTTQKDITINEKHFDFSVLINILAIYITDYSSKGTDWIEQKEYWCTVVGRAQCYLPAYLMQHYCEPYTKFSPPDAKQFIRSLRFWNPEIQMYMTWSGMIPSAALILGVDFGIAHHSDGAWARRFQGLRVPSHNAEDLMKLCEVRILDYLAIPSRIASLIKKKTAIEERLNGCPPTGSHL